jgi:hypothetical protein
MKPAKRREPEEKTGKISYRFASRKCTGYDYNSSKKRNMTGGRCGRVCKKMQFFS